MDKNIRDFSLVRNSYLTHVILLRLFMRGLFSGCIGTHSHGRQVMWERCGSVLDSRSRGCGFEPHRRHCVAPWARNINPCLVLVQHRKTHPNITEKIVDWNLKNQINQTNCQVTWMFSQSDSVKVIQSKWHHHVIMHLSIIREFSKFILE